MSKNEKITNAIILILTLSMIVYGLYATLKLRYGY